MPLKANLIADHSPTNLLILYDSIVGKKPLMKAIEKVKAKVIYEYHFIHGMAICKSEEMTLEESMAYFRKVKGVLSVEYDQIIRLTDPVKPRLQER